MKREKASQLVMDLWRAGDGVISIQVLKEFYVIVTRKLLKPMRPEAAGEIVGQYLAWEVVPCDAALLKSGIDLSRSAQLPLWDALVVQAAPRAGCGILYTEDLTHGQRFGSLEVVNPFLPSFDE